MKSDIRAFEENLLTSRSGINRGVLPSNQKCNGKQLRQHYSLQKLSISKIKPKRFPKKSKDVNH